MILTKEEIFEKYKDNDEAMALLNDFKDDLPGAVVYLEDNVRYDNWTEELYDDLCEWLYFRDKLKNTIGSLTTVSQLWEALSIKGQIQLSEKYPETLPSFDDLVYELKKWADTV